MKRRAFAIAALLVLAGAAAVAIVPGTCQAAIPTITSLSRSRAKVGVSLTIKGRNFGAARTGSSVTFGERRNTLGFAPCATRARVLSWGDTSISVRVPRMAPGSHPIYVTVGGRGSRSSSFTITPVKTISDRTFTTSSFSGNVLPSGHDVLYDNCTFTATNPGISGANSGVMCLGQNSTRHHGVTFRDCTFTSNTGAGSGGDYGVNGIKLVDVDGSVRDITFQGCTIGAMSRMGFEAITAGSRRAGLTNIELVDCTFEPCGAEPVSFGSHGAVYGLVDGCLLKGYGNLASPQYGAGFEANRATHIVVRDTRIWAGRGAAINVRGPGGSGDCYLLFQNVHIDISHRIQPYPTDDGSRLLAAGRMHGSRWRNCTFNTGDADNHCYNAGWAEGGNAWATCHRNDLSGSTITGYCGSIAGAPTTAAGYWDPGVPADNALPKLSR